MARNDHLPFVGLALIFCAFGSACFKSDDGGIWRVGEIAPLDRLALRLSTEYKRSIDQNDFSLFYKPLPPKTIVLEVRYKKKMDQSLLKKIIASAEENAKGVARDQFKLNIDTKVDEREYKSEN